MANRPNARPPARTRQSRKSRCGHCSPRDRSDSSGHSAQSVAQRWHRTNSLNPLHRAFDAVAAAGGAAASVEEGIEALQSYSKEVSRRLLDSDLASLAAPPSSSVSICFHILISLYEVRSRSIDYKCQKHDFDELRLKVDKVGRINGHGYSCGCPKCHSHSFFDNCCSHLKILHTIELDKSYPQDIFQAGRARVQLKKDDGSPINPAIKTSEQTAYLLSPKLNLEWDYIHIILYIFRSMIKYVMDWCLRQKFNLAGIIAYA
ncbi:Signal recognition particle 19 kDa protein [Zea mays]|uniref:Signal recognition particle 19 kDa protein n=1 Tax=Zea mays TaxID=4577 RepID=K7WB22_MAIZE|nr:Signal recognition particle 19 kDa protein [Zea mays]